MVSLQREPNNPYDKNAIKVNNVNGNQVGHLKRNLAAALASLMDNKLVQVEGYVLLEFVLVIVIFSSLWIYTHFLGIWKCRGTILWCTFRHVQFSSLTFLSSYQTVVHLFFYYYHGEKQTWKSNLQLYLASRLILLQILHDRYALPEELLVVGCFFCCLKRGFAGRTWPCTPNPALASCVLELEMGTIMLSSLAHFRVFFISYCK